MNLINPKIFQQRLSNFDFPTGGHANKIVKNIVGWQTALKDRDLSKTKEKSVRDFFCRNSSARFSDIQQRQKEKGSGI